MQIKRKRRDVSSRRKNIIRIVLFLIGSIASIILFNIINEKDEFTSVGAGYTKTDGGGEGTMLRGESSLNENIDSANNDQIQRQDMYNNITEIEAQDIKQTQDVVASDLHETTLQSEVDIEQVIQPEQDIKSEQKIQPEISPLSLLHSPDAIKNLPPCDGIRHDLSTSPNTIQVDTSQIAILSNWSPSAINKWSNRTQFQSTFGNYPQYIKGKDVQPLTDKNGDQCTAKLLPYLMQCLTFQQQTTLHRRMLWIYSSLPIIRNIHPFLRHYLPITLSPVLLKAYLPSRMVMDFKYSPQWKKDHHIHFIHMMLHGLDRYQVLAFGTFYIQIRQSR